MTGRSFLEAMEQVISLMYEAAVCPALWPTALEALATGVQAGGANLEVYDKRATEFAGFMGGSVPDFVLYREYYYRLDPLTSITWVAPAGESALLCHEHISAESVAKSEFYQDFLIPKHGRYRADWHLENNADQLIVLGLFKERKPFERSELCAWERVAFHAHQAVRLAAKVSPLLARGELLRQALDHKKMSCIMVGSNARVLDCSTAAANLLESGTVLRLRDQSRLTALSKEDTGRLRNLITAAAIGRTGGALRLADHSLLQVVPSGVAQKNPFDSRFAHCALVFVTQPKSPTSPDWRSIQVILDCTRAEAEVAADLGSGISPTEIAAKRNVSLSTVRTQIRILLERTGLHRTAELVSHLSKIR